MKTLFHTLFAAALCAWLSVSEASAQEIDSKTVPKPGEKQPTGVAKLADRIQNFGFLEYARKLVDRLDKKERTIDPFGMAMDPQQKGAELALVEEGPVAAEDTAVKTTLQEAVSRFRVTGVYPNRKEVIVGAQSLRVGDNVVIKHGDFSFRLKLSKVEADSVELTDLETGETAGVSLGIVQAIPQGMTRKQPPVQSRAGEANSDGSIVPMNRRQLTLDLSSELEPNIRQK